MSASESHHKEIAMTIATHTTGLYTVTLAALNDQVRDIFAISGMLGFFRVAPTVDEALASQH